MSRYVGHLSYLALLLIVVAGIQTLTMPRFLYPGDAFASRAEAINLLSTGSMGIDYGQRDLLGGLSENRGQYFFENDRQQKLYSKFGLGQTLFYMPPLVVERWLTGDALSPLHSTHSFICILSFYQIIFAIITAAYLYECAGLYTHRRWLQFLFVILSIYSTYLWHYLRAPTHEVFQLAAIAGFCFHSLAFLKSSAHDIRSWKHLLLATIYIGILMLCKLSYALLLLPLWALPYLIESNGVRAESATTQQRTTTVQVLARLWANRRSYFLFLATPTVVALILIAATNYFRFGSPFESGYRQWCDERGEPLAYLSLTKLLESLPAVFYRLGNANLFVHYPLLVFAIIGFPAFWKRFRRESKFILLACLPSIFVLCSFSAWHGEWCYGPRYFLPFALMASIPSIELMDRSADAMKPWGALVFVSLVVVSLWSFCLQASVNATHYFAYHYTSGLFGQVKVPAVVDYFQGCPHRGVVHRDILAHRYFHRTFLPIHEVERRLAPGQTDVITQMGNFIDQQAALNLYWFYPNPTVPP